MRACNNNNKAEFRLAFNYVKVIITVKALRLSATPRLCQALKDKKVFRKSPPYDFTNFYFEPYYFLSVCVNKLIKKYSQYARS